MELGRAAAVCFAGVQGGNDDLCDAAAVLHQEPQVCGRDPAQQDLAVMQPGSRAAGTVSVGASVVRAHMGFFFFSF